MIVRFSGQKKKVHFEGSVPLWEQVQILPRSGEIDSKLDFGGSLLKLAHLNSIVETIGWNWLLWTRLWRPLAESDIPICATGITQMGQRVNAQQRKQILTSFALQGPTEWSSIFQAGLSPLFTLFSFINIMLKDTKTSSDLGNRSRRRFDVLKKIKTNSTPCWH